MIKAAALWKVEHQAEQESTETIVEIPFEDNAIRLIVEMQCRFRIGNPGCVTDGEYLSFGLTDGMFSANLRKIIENALLWCND